MLALLNPSDAIVREVPDDRVDLDAGIKAGFRWLPIVDEVTDTSTPGSPYVVTEPVVQTIEADRVLRSRARRDMTAPEIDALKVDTADALSTESVGKMFLSVFRVLYGIAQQVNPSITPAQFKTFVDNETAATDITAAAFKAWVKDRL